MGPEESLCYILGIKDEFIFVSGKMSCIRLVQYSG